jgi:hypothetical protein
MWGKEAGAIVETEINTEVVREPALRIGTFVPTAANARLSSY